MASYKDFDEDFSGKVQPPFFRNLKKSLNRHHQSELHRGNILNCNIGKEIEEKYLCREMKIGLVVGDICYYLLNQGRSYEDFTLLVNIMSKAGVDMGDINHSKFSGRVFSNSNLTS